LQTAVFFKNIYPVLGEEFAEKLIKTIVSIGKGKVKFSLYLIKHHSMQTYGEVDV
jgi:hypothetical protein